MVFSWRSFRARSRAVRLLARCFSANARSQVLVLHGRHQVGDRQPVGRVRGFGILARGLAPAGGRRPAGPAEQVVGVLGGELPRIGKGRRGAVRGHGQARGIQGAGDAAAGGSVGRGAGELPRGAPGQVLAHLPGDAEAVGGVALLKDRTGRLGLVEEGNRAIALGLDLQLRIEGPFLLQGPGPGFRLHLPGDGHLEVVAQRRGERLAMPEAQRLPRNLGGQPQAASRQQHPRNTGLHPTRPQQPVPFQTSAHPSARPEFRTAQSRSTRTNNLMCDRSRPRFRTGSGFRTCRRAPGCRSTSGTTGSRRGCCIRAAARRRTPGGRPQPWR